MAGQLPQWFTELKGEGRLVQTIDQPGRAFTLKVFSKHAANVSHLHGHVLFLVQEM